MASEIKAYKCDYCNKISRTRAGIVNHESNCRYNPTLKFCHTCKHCDMHGIVYEEDNEVFGKIESRGMFCNYYNEPIIRGKDAVYFRECEVEYMDNDDELNIPCTCLNYVGRADNG